MRRFIACLVATLAFMSVSFVWRSEELPSYAKLLMGGVIPANADVAITEANFPDDTFREYVSSNFDTDENGVLSDDEIAEATGIYVGGSNISSLKGIEYFTALTSLICDNNQLTALDVSNNTALKYLYCYENQLTELDLSNNTALTSLYCSNNQLAELDLSKNTALMYLGCFGNQLTELDLSNNNALEELLPDGLTFDTSTGVISGTPTSYGKNGNFKITITASNPVGSRSKSITFKVKGTKPTIKATFPNATAGEYYSVNLTATGSDPITWTADLPDFLTLNGDTIAGTVPESFTKTTFKVKVYAENPVKTVNKTYTIKVITTNKKGLPENLNDDNDTGSTENESDNETPTDNNAGKVQGVTGVTGDSTQTEDQKSGIPESYIVVAELGEISRDVAGMYDFEVELPDSVSAGSELIYIANSERPSDDDEIAEFFDDTGKEITAVPESRKISVSVWLNAETIYKPAIAIKH